MKREEFIEKWGASMGHGFTDEELSADLDELLSLPPAEGAEEILQKYMDMSMIICPLHVVPRTVALDAMHEFAAQQHPTAEGAEEILEDIAMRIDASGVGNNRDAIKRFYRDKLNTLATLHAQRIADKMVSERLREELIAYTKAKWTYDPDMPIQIVDEYLKTREP